MKQKIFKGELYEQGINGQHVLIVGHQIHASNDEVLKYLHMTNWDQQFIKDFSNQNNAQMKEVINGFICDNGEKWRSSDRRSHLKFARTLLGRDFNPNNSSWGIFWNSLAFCNYLQVPDIDLKNRSGKDKEFRYKEAQIAFREYLYELRPQPDIIIVWGVNVYPHIESMASTIIDSRHCILSLTKLNPINIVCINHPCQAGYDKNRKLLEPVKLYPVNVQMNF